MEEWSPLRVMLRLPRKAIIIVFAGENMTIFVGEGPLNKDGARNPDAKGLLVSEATIGLSEERR